MERLKKGHLTKDRNPLERPKKGHLTKVTKISRPFGQAGQEAAASFAAAEMEVEEET